MELGDQVTARTAAQELATTDTALATALGAHPGGEGQRGTAAGLNDAVRRRLMAIVEERGEAKRRVRRADSYQLQGDWERARAELETLAAEYPDYPDVRLRLGTLLHRRTQHDHGLLARQARGGQGARGQAVLSG